VDIAVGFGAIAIRIGVAMLHPHVLSTPLATALLAGWRLGKVRS